MVGLPDSAGGGVPREILYDRMKTVVGGEDPDGLVVHNRALLNLSLPAMLGWRGAERGGWIRPIEDRPLRLGEVRAIRSPSSSRARAIASPADRSTSMRGRTSAGRWS